MNASFGSWPWARRLPKVAYQEQVTLQLSPSLSRELTLQNGRFDQRDPLITAETFPVFVRRAGHRSVWLVRLDRKSTSRQVRELMYKRDQILCGADPLLGLNLKQPHLFRDRRVVALGQSWTPLGGQPRVLNICEALGRRILLTTKEEQVWPVGTWFLTMDQLDPYSEPMF